MFVKVFEQNGKYTICKVLQDGSMDPDYLSISDINDKGDAYYIADRIIEAYRWGKADKAKEIRKALEV